MGARSRRKGKRTENEAAALLRTVFPNARRALGQVRTSSGRDFDGTPGFCLQLKAGANPSWSAAMREAEASARAGEVAVGLTRRDREGTYAHVRLADLLELLVDRGERDSNGD
jgi:hypothetical protein